MKIRRIFKSLAAAVLALAVLGAATLNSVVFAPRAEASGLNKGDIIELGSYPQQRVTDEALLSALDSQEKDWISYNYYSGTDGESAGSMESGDWMKYADFTYDGIKYRAVTFQIICRTALLTKHRKITVTLRRKRTDIKSTTYTILDTIPLFGAFSTPRAGLLCAK